MSIGKVRGHLFTTKTQTEGAISALESLNIELGDLKAESSHNKYLLERLSNIVFGKVHKAGKTFEDLVAPIQQAFSVPVTELEYSVVEAQNEVQRLRNLEVSLRDELGDLKEELEYEKGAHTMSRIKLKNTIKNSEGRTYSPPEGYVLLKATEFEETLEKAMVQAAKKIFS